jgi:hypothetical protein
MTRHAPTPFRAFALLALLALLPALPARAAESLASCNHLIAALPATVNLPGVWCLDQNLSTAIATGAAIAITAHNSVLDCNGFKVEGTAGAATDADGITAAGRNITVRNCDVRGFRIGIAMGGPYASGPFYVEDNRAAQNWYNGIRVLGYGAIIRGNRISDTGGSTVYLSPAAISSGYALDISDNTVAGVTATAGGGGNATGIVASLYLEGANISGNRVRDIVGDGAGASVGIDITTGYRAVITGNDVIGSTGTAVRCVNTESRVKGNVLSGFTTGISLCGNGGGNVIRP